jgi:hypothetical protein
MGTHAAFVAGLADFIFTEPTPVLIVVSFAPRSKELLR